MFLVGCQSGEPLNKECDILDVTLKETGVLRSVSVSNDKIILFVYNDADVTALTPIITVTEGAKITPGSGVTQNFSKVIKYTVVSEDGEWKKVYDIKVSKLPDVKNLTFDFNEWDDVPHRGGNYWNPVGYWASGNPGVAILRSVSPAAKRPDYPTMYTDTVGDVISGKAVLMINQKGFGPPAGFMVPGSLFLGIFKTANALVDPLSCPQFGMPVYCTKDHKPEYFSFWYKYTPGKVTIDAKGEVVNKTDKCNIYSVIYLGETPLTPKELADGVNSKRVIAYAQLQDKGATDGWVFANIKYEYNVDTWDQTDVVQIAIVMTSSIEGDSFIGAVGSKLVVDDVTVR